MSELITRENAKKAICECCYMFKYIGDSYTECRYYPCDDIKALEAIPSAEAEQVTSKLKKHCDSLLTGDSDECKEQKSKLESAEAVQGWIPCSDRLPNNDGCVLVTIDDGIEFGKYEDGSWSIWVCEHWDEWDAKGTIAWMPLPKPYKGGEDE